MSIEETKIQSSKEKDHHPFENQIFDHYRKNKLKIERYIQFLKENGYEVFEKKRI